MLERTLTSEARIISSAPIARPGERGRLPAPERRQRLVVAGFGMVAYKLVERLSALEALGRYAVTLIGEEPYLAYDRVRLTGWLDHRDSQRLALGRPGWSEALDIRVITGNPVASIDRENHSGRLTTSDAMRPRYFALVWLIATLGLAGYLAFNITGEDRSAFLPGTTTDGH